jgi:uncharacterized membrane protein
MSFTEKKFSKLALLAAIVALVGLGDAIYLTVNHYTAAPPPCTITEGCEKVLTSSYATIMGVPLALFGALAYFSAFVLALLSAFGNRWTWRLFAAQIVFMAAFSIWLIYLQAFVLGAFCQFCLLSAGVTFTLLAIALISFFSRPKYA